MSNVVKPPKRPIHQLTEQHFGGIARLFSVLAEPMRLRILRKLQSGPASVNAIVDELQTTQANVSKHLKLLHDARLVDRKRDGNFVRYSIADQIVFELCHLVCDKMGRDARDHAWF